MPTDPCSQFRFQALAGAEIKRIPIALPKSHFSFSRQLVWRRVRCFSSSKIMQTKVTTVIVNATKQGLTMKVGNRNCYAKLTSVKVGGGYRMHVDVRWTYQKFLLEHECDTENQVFTNSDDCIDFERITIKEISGKFDVQRGIRKQFRTTNAGQESGSISGWKSMWLHKFM